jgi:hypothetical protein
MRYGIHLLPDAFLLVALLRMTFVGLAAERRAIFFFLCAWLVYCFVTLFLGQLWPAGSSQYALRFFILSAAAWACAVPALWLASRVAVRSLAHTAVIMLVVLMASGASRLALENFSMSPIAKLLAIHFQFAVVAGTVFWFASLGAEGPDLYLWRCCGIFFLLFGFGNLAIGMLRPGAWAYACLVLAAAVVWVALAWFIGPHPEHLFNLEKLALVPSARLRLALGIPLAGSWMGIKKICASGTVQNDTDAFEKR